MESVRNGTDGKTIAAEVAVQIMGSGVDVLDVGFGRSGCGDVGDPESGS